MVYLILANGFEETEAVTVVDILRRADIQIKTVSIMEDRLVYGAHGMGLEADTLFKEVDFGTCSMAVLPGGMPGTLNLCNYKPLSEELMALNNEGKPLAAICAAPMVLGRLGLLKGKRATIYDGMEEELAGADYINKDVVADKGIITSKGPGTAMIFALSLVAYIKGEEKAAEVRAALLYR
jgi:4-methyl-5(b-hydroxyethyl)-thiazole monophosphate biosynthesis